MLSSRNLAALEGKVRPLVRFVPPDVAIGVYSRGRLTFLRRFVGSPAKRPVQLPPNLERTLWGVRFQLPLLNAAGMFKSGEGYDVVAAQGAGGYLAGTTTGHPRQGNDRYGVRQPFAPYPTSGAASNWLGLPNPGHRAVAQRLRDLPRQEGCPVGASLSADATPELDVKAKLEALLQGLRLYQEAAVDFLEINESCPNTEDGEHGLEVLAGRLEAIQKRVLDRRRRRLPVIVKLSSDTEVGMVPMLIDLLAEKGFDGVNFGNTSIAYDRHRDAIAPAERALYDNFTRRFGGGVSGRPLRQDALSLVTAAADHLRARPAPDEFHVIATGGIETGRDVHKAMAQGASLCQWYTGYFESFGQHGHAVYQHLATELSV